MGALARTLIISDLHLGSTTDVDVLRKPEALEALLNALGDVDRLVLLGDTVELRHGHSVDALGAARPVLEQIGAALPAMAEVVMTVGNHDHSMFAPYLDYATEPLGLDALIEPSLASPIARGAVSALGAERTTLRYPGVRIRDDVYAMHGHYGDVHTTLPLFERLAAGVMGRVATKVPEAGAVAEDYERVLAPMYAWLDAVSQRTPSGRKTITSGQSGPRLYEVLAGRGHKTLSHRALAVGFPLAVRAMVPVVGRLSSDLSIGAVERGGVRAMGEVARRLGINRGHLISGHTHRAGPLAGDSLAQWSGSSGVRLHNTGCWVFERHFMPSPHADSPYWPGTAIAIEDDGDPQLVRLLSDFQSF